jgi:hypothetical protein
MSKGRMSEIELLEKLGEYPELREQFEQLVMLVENSKGDATRADDAERQVIERMRELGQKTLQGWANRQSQKMVERVSKQKPDMKKHVKKNCNGTRHTEK